MALLGFSLLTFALAGSGATRNLGLLLLDSVWSLPVQVTLVY